MNGNTFSGTGEEGGGEVEEGTLQFPWLPPLSMVINL